MLDDGFEIPPQWRRIGEADHGKANPTAFLEVFVDTPLEECIRRDPKGLYAKARAGRLEHFTGLDSAYEPPEAFEIRIATIGVTPDAAAEQILEELRARKII